MVAIDCGKRKDPWTDPDPQPGDFDEYLAEMGPEHIQHVEAGSGGKVVLIEDNDVDSLLRRREEREKAGSARPKR